MPIFNTEYKSYYEIPKSGLLAYYPLTSDANDHKADLGVSGTTYNGTWYGTASYGTVLGKTGASFSRGSNRIDTGVNRTSLPISICIWLYCTDKSNRQTSIGNPNGNNSYGYSIRSADSEVKITNGTGSDISIMNNFSTGNWYNIIMTIESGTTKVYVNGNLTTTSSSGNTASGGSFYIASYGSYTSFGFNGYIRDVAIYNRVLSSSEVSKYYDTTK